MSSGNLHRVAALYTTKPMANLFDRIGRLTTGAAAAGFVVGIGEAWYRGVPLTYAAFLYAALWTVIGVFAAIPMALLLGTDRAPTWRRRTTWPGMAWGFTCALTLSAGVLVRFVVSRDVLGEAPGTWVQALAAGLGAGVVLAAVAGVTLPWLERRWLATAGRGRVALLLPVIALSGFAVLATRPSDDLLYENNREAVTIAGKGVILIVADALRADAIGAYGASPHRGADATPNLDAFARDSMVFTNAHAQASWTKPALASILSGRSVSGHNTMAKAAVLPDNLPTIGTTLQVHDVTTAAVVTNYNLAREFGFARGFDEFDYLPPARYLGAPPEANRLAAYNVYRLARERLFRGSREARHFYRPGKDVNTTALDVLDRVGNGRFFLWLHYMEPHDPYFGVDGRSFAKVSDPHPAAADKGAMHDAYRDSVRAFDSAFGALMTALAARGMANTMVIVVADHGEEFGEHGGYYHGTSLYEELLHIPLMVRGPGLSPGANGRLARQIDIAPTVLSFLGETPPEAWEGRDLINGAAADASLAEEDHEGNVLSAITTGEAKLIVANQDNPRGLPPVQRYDLRHDPAEQTPLPIDASADYLKTKLGTLQDEARRGSSQATLRPLDAGAKAELRTLGYVQ